VIQDFTAKRLAIRITATESPAKSEAAGAADPVRVCGGPFGEGGVPIKANNSRAKCESAETSALIALYPLGSPGTARVGGVRLSSESHNDRTYVCLTPKALGLQQRISGQEHSVRYACRRADGLGG